MLACAGFVPPKPALFIPGAMSRTTMLKNLRRAAKAQLVCASLSSLLALPADAQNPSPATASRPAPAAVLEACFVYVSPVGQAGWSYQHDLGRQAMLQALGGQVRSRVVEAVAEGPDSERVMRDLATQGCGLIFATSFGYLEPALRVAADFPQVKFEHAGGYKTAANLNTYNARYYEARWLAGWLAGKQSKTGVAGYVAGFPVPEVVQGINAFTLGMRAVNPKAEVKLVWLNAWFDPPREREAALSLIGQGADVLTNHSGSPAVPQVAEEKGVLLLAYQSDMSRFAPKAQLASVSHHWGGYYTQVAQAVIKGTWQPQPVWGGMKDGLVQLSAVNPALPAEVKAGLAQRQKALLAGKLKPFAAPLIDNSGRSRLATGELADPAIATMDWLVQGVTGSLPTAR